MEKKKLASLLAVIGIMFITMGVSYANYSSKWTGTTENTIKSGSVKFHYQEGNRSINLTNSIPLSDENGKTQLQYFDFTITSQTSNEMNIPYYITIRKKGNDNSLNDVVKFYLTEIDNNIEKPLTLQTGNSVEKYNLLTPYVNTAMNITQAKNEKVLYIGDVPTNTTNYEKKYRLRMWLSDSVDVSDYYQTITGSCSDPNYTTKEDCEQNRKDWTEVATGSEKTFTVTVNVYTAVN